LEALAVKPVTPSKSAAYTIVPFMPDGSTSKASNVADINDHGQAVGKLEYADGVHEAIHRDVDGVYTTLVGGTFANGINNSNEVVGTNGTSALFWSSPQALPISLPPLSGDSISWAYRINDDGVVIGESASVVDGDYLSAPVVWRVFASNEQTWQIDGPLRLPPLQAGAFTLVWDINEVVNGVAQVVGESASHVVIWTVEVDAEDGTLAVPPVQAVGATGLIWSTGYGINNLADICGVVDGLPYVDFTGQDPQVLPLPRKVTAGSARDINDDGDIVGYATEWTKFYPGRDYAQLWRDGQRIDLATQIPDDSGWERLSSAQRINNHGVIGGLGVFDVYYRGFIMIPNEN
jgi:uncharacterized membrane protein